MEKVNITNCICPEISVFSPGVTNVSFNSCFLSNIPFTDCNEIRVIRTNVKTTTGERSCIRSHSGTDIKFSVIGSTLSSSSELFRLGSSTVTVNISKWIFNGCNIGTYVTKINSHGNLTYSTPMSGDTTVVLNKKRD